MGSYYDAALIQKAFNHYKRGGKAYAPEGEKSIEFRKLHSHESREVKFVGVWDTVGAMAIDEHREDFMPTIWSPRENMG